MKQKKAGNLTVPRRLRYLPDLTPKKLNQVHASARKLNFFKGCHHLIGKFSNDEETS